ncbi:MAG: indolepyruvate oxidoreductase subunit beta [Thermoplasmata archaeon]|nr:indolepyruvate oxidoreductase subunit beta [Thermoplasmata archaeon]
MVDIYLVGVGGQGIITASKIIGDAALISGEEVVMSETHGMAQRGGSVICTTRIGGARSSLIPDGRADVVVSLELLETLRAADKMSGRTTVLASTERMVPLSLSRRKDLRYPSVDEVTARLRTVAGPLVIVDARRLAEDAGVPISSNIVMIGALAGSGATGLPDEAFEKAIGRNIRRNVDENLVAFARGRDFAKKALASKV